MISSGFEWAVRVDSILRKHLSLSKAAVAPIREEIMELVDMEMAEKVENSVRWSENEDHEWDGALAKMETRLTKQVFRVSLTLVLLLAMAVIGLVLAG